MALPVETNKALVDAVARPQSYYLDLFRRLLPPGYLDAIKSPGPGYELFQAFASVAERVSRAVARAQVGNFLRSAAGGQKARAFVRFSRPTASAGAVTVTASTVVTTSKGDRRFVLLADAVFSPSDLGPVTEFFTNAPGELTWVTRTDPASAVITRERCVIWAGSFFVASGIQTGASTYVVTSPDGITWTQRLAGTFAGSAINAGKMGWNGSYVVVICDAACGATKVMISSDGISWTSSTGFPSTIGAISRPVWNGSVWAIVGTENGAGSGSGTSPDGLNWTNHLMPGGAGATYNALAWNDSIYVAMGTVGVLATSPDGVTWTAQAPVGAGTWRDVEWNGTTFVAVGDASIVATSPDGINWTTRTIPSGNWRNVKWNGAYFLAVGNSLVSGAVAATSTDGITWTTRAAPSAAFSSFSPGGGPILAWNGRRWVVATAQTADPRIQTATTPGNTLEAEAIHPDYAWNARGRRTAADGTVLPGEIDTVRTLYETPPFGDPTIAVDQVDDAQGGQAAYLDGLGADRGVARVVGETDEVYRLRVLTLPDTVSLDAVKRAVASSFAPYGVTATVVETWDVRYQTCYDAPATTLPNPDYDPNLFVYDDPRAAVPFRNRWLDEADYRAAFIVVVPRLSINQLAMAFDDAATGPADLLVGAGGRAAGAFDVPLAFTAARQGAYDGSDTGIAAVYLGLYNLLQQIKAGGVTAVLELEGN